MRNATIVDKSVRGAWKYILEKTLRFMIPTAELEMMNIFQKHSGLSSEMKKLLILEQCFKGKLLIKPIWGLDIKQYIFSSSRCEVYSLLNTIM